MIPRKRAALSSQEGYKKIVTRKFVNSQEWRNC